MLEHQISDPASTILLVEDDEVITEAIVFHLRKRGYLCRTARNGLEGLRTIRNSPPDLLIMDLMLPEMDGWELCRQLRQEGFQMPIIICSARTGESDKVRGLSLGADDYLGKPFGMDELAARVEANLRRARIASSPKGGTLTCGPLVIDPARKEAVANDEPIGLTPREFAVLYFLASRTPDTLSREEIYRRVWGYTMIPGNRSVDVFIRRIRHKLARKVPQHDFLHTQYGFGYRFKLTNS